MTSLPFLCVASFEAFRADDAVRQAHASASARAAGAFELVARFSATFSDKALLDSAKVAGYATTDFTDPNAKLAGDATGAGASVTAEQMLCFRCIIRT